MRILVSPAAIVQLWLFDSHVYSTPWAGSEAPCGCFLSAMTIDSVKKVMTPPSKATRRGPAARGGAAQMADACAGATTSGAGACGIAGGSVCATAGCSPAQGFGGALGAGSGSVSGEGSPGASCCGGGGGSTGGGAGGRAGTTTA